MSCCISSQWRTCPVVSFPPCRGSPLPRGTQPRDFLGHVCGQILAHHEETSMSSCFSCIHETHNGGMRFKPIAIAIGLTIGGAVATAFSTPPYPLQMPSVIEHAEGLPAVLRIRAWNLRPQPATVSYLGDCCSIRQSTDLPPFSTRVLEIELLPKKLPGWTINKVAAFQITSGSMTFVKGMPYQVRVKRL